ncbi:alkaline phosphatase family protein [Microvirga sp. VF16]|uniref:alkaline phosphatase family protein n=1 Tax=Microvirga sp. VF16 TaxID=2807101 RepID=UPI00193CAED2|nr:alkaline phosphatase family protein [Microvirga sp. VF16]QRM33021.1 alkaline phosphatase family protein [Microvirga sp. VF16]
MSAAVQGSRRRVVVLILDGLRRDFIRPDLTPNLVALKARATWCNSHRSVFPSVTRVVSSCMATGCLPARHGLAGNMVALLNGDDLDLYDVGKPEFLEHKQRLTGHVLAKPTLAERLAEHGGVIVFNNVSPGAAYMHDPLGHGHVYHRAGSYGPGRTPIDGQDALKVGSDIAGDRVTIDRFVDEIVHARKPALALAWLGHPDTSQHECPLGSPEHLKALNIVDGHAGQVIAAVDDARAAGEDILLIVGSDHGHQTVTGIVDIAAELVAAGLKASPESADVVVAPNGTAALIYVDRRHAERAEAIRAFLEAQTWVGEVIRRSDFAIHGIPEADGLTLAIAMAADDDGTNEFGIPGLSLAVKPVEGKADRLGCGQHGGLGRYEQSPFLILDGAGFAPGRIIADVTSAIDIAPTVLTHLGQPADALDGRPLQSKF